jgi:vitamin B12 transporter
MAASVGASACDCASRWAMVRKPRVVLSLPLRTVPAACVLAAGVRTGVPLMSSPKPLSCLAAAGLLLPVLASAQASPPREPELVVTASRTRLAIDRSLSAVSVIDRARIEAAGALDLVDLLRREAGFDVIRSGGLGAQTSVFLRGANSNQTLVLIDGVRVSSATTGSFAWEQLALEQVERIEIVRGPRAALYGSDAIGGVVQIFTRRAPGSDVTLGVGNHDTWRLDAGSAWQGERGRLGLRLGRVDTRGFNAQNPRGFAFDPDRDGYRQDSLLLDAAAAFEAAHWDLGGQLVDGEVEFDRGVSAVRNASLSTGLASADAERWSLRLALADNEVVTPAFFARFETERRQLDGQYLARLDAGNSLLWGASVVREEGASINTRRGQRLYGEVRDHLAGFLAWRGQAAALHWELAARHDDFDGFGGRRTGQAAVGGTLGSGWRWRGSLGQGFRAPNLNELYSPGFGGLFAGNPALDPERSTSAELGLDGTLGGVAWSLSAYDSRVVDLIDFVGGDTFQAINIGRARLRGIELGGRWRGEAWQLGGNLGWQQAENRDSGADLLRRAPRKATLEIERRLGDWWLGADLHAAGPRPEFGGTLPGYGVLGLALRRELGAAWTLRLRVDNLLDRDYALARGFNAAGTTVLLQLGWRSAH